MLRYGQFCPVAKTAEIFADRWTPLILRELCFQPCLFGELVTALPLISRTMLAQRLKELADAEVIEIEPKSRGRGHIYRLTPAGEEFRPLIEMMFTWGQRWAFRRIGPDDLDTSQLMLGAPRHVDPGDMPAARMVIRFEFRGVPTTRRSPRYWWWVIQRPDIDVCLKDPGYHVDLVVRADLAAFTGLFLGHLGLREALATGKVGFEGTKSAIAGLCRLLRLENDPAPRVFAYARDRASVTIPLGAAAD
jgi:DNA-binding HxlR family transcriptional regulator